MKLDNKTFQKKKLDNKKNKIKLKIKKKKKKYLRRVVFPLMPAFIVVIMPHAIFRPL